MVLTLMKNVRCIVKWCMWTDNSSLGLWRSYKPSLHDLTSVQMIDIQVEGDDTKGADPNVFICYLKVFSVIGT